MEQTEYNSSAGWWFVLVPVDEGTVALNR